MRFYLLLLLFTALPHISVAEESAKIFASVEVLALSPDYEAPIQIVRDLLPQHFHKKIVLGLGPTYRFSRLVLIWIERSPDATPGKIDAPHVLFSARTDKGKSFELAVDLNTGAVEIDGKILKKGEIQQHVLEYAQDMVGRL